MRTVRFGLLCVVSFVLVSADAGARQVIINGSVGQSPIQMPGVGQPDVKTGTGRIRGRIVAADTGAPVRRAQVRITGNAVAMKTSLSDGDGRYEFRDLPAGRFTLAAQKPGYMTVQYGQTRPFESGKTIELAEAQVLDKADISMPRGSVIAGRIIDEFGEPIADVAVAAMRSTWSNGKRRLQAAGRAAGTNDLGQYRIFGLAPGDYYVSATFRGGDMAMMEMAMAAATGGGGSAGPSGSTPNSGYAPTYFPGTTSGGDAQKITLNVGQEAQGTDFALLPVRLAKISGTVIGSDGKPAEGTTINALPRVAGDDIMFGPSTSARADKIGSFTLTNVPPGEYTLQTRGTAFMTSSNDGGRMVFTMTRTVSSDGPGGSEPEFGSVPISVAGDDISNVVILTSKGTTATGHVAFDGGTQPAGAANMRVMAVATDGEGLVSMGGGAGAIKPDGTFELKGLAGSRIIRPFGLPQGWTLKSVRLNGQDITDTGIDFKGNDPVNGLEVAVTNKSTEINGGVRDASGNTVKDYTVVVFSDDAQKWTVPQGRYIAGVRPDTEGRFQVKNLPPGGYYAVAMDYIAQGEWGDPELLERLKGKATRISLDEGETRTIELKIAG